MQDFPSFSLVLGGASSGKSAFAERLTLSSGKAPLYIATAQSHDAEMARKIKAHQHRRGPQWKLLEAPLALAPAISSASGSQIILLDCLTLWLSNLMMADLDIQHETKSLLEAIRACAAPVIAVSNEIGFGLVPDTPLGRAFRDAQGQLNQHAAAAADLAVFVAAGLPLALKGALPRCMI